jgi:hypothetical protein
MVAAQHSVHPTGGTRRVCRQFAWLGVGSGKVALSPPAHPRVTPAVGQLIAQSGQIKAHVNILQQNKEGHCDYKTRKLAAKF